LLYALVNLFNIFGPGIATKQSFLAREFCINSSTWTLLESTFWALQELFYGKIRFFTSSA
jgi:hypothetical protein